MTGELPPCLYCFIHADSMRLFRSVYMFYDKCEMINIDNIQMYYCISRLAFINTSVTLMSIYPFRNSLLWLLQAKSVIFIHYYYYYYYYYYTFIIIYVQLPWTNFFSFFLIFSVNMSKIQLVVASATYFYLMIATNPYQYQNNYLTTKSENSDNFSIFTSRP